MPTPAPKSAEPVKGSGPMSNFAVSASKWPPIRTVRIVAAGIIAETNARQGFVEQIPS